MSHSPDPRSRLPARARTLFLVVAGVVVVAVLGAIVLRRWIDPERYRRLLEERVSSAIGREVRLGEIGVSLFPGVGLRVDRLEVAGLPEEGGDDLLVADSLRVSAALLPLLRGRLEVRAAEIEGARLQLVRDAAKTWNVERLLAERGEARQGEGGERDRASGDSESSAAARVAVDRVAFTDSVVTIRDRSIEPAVELVLDQLQLELDDLAEEGSFDVVLDTRFGGAPDARLRWSGAAGPLGAAGQPFALRGKGTVEEVSPAVLIGLARLAGVDASKLAAQLESIGGTVEVDAAFPERATLRGALDLGTVQVALPAAGGERRLAIDVESRFDLATERGADVVRIAQLEIDLDRATLDLEGTVESAGDEGRRVDLTLQPASLPADRLAAFLAVALPDLPFSFSSPRPLEVEARIRGLVRPGQRPGIDGRMRVADLRLAHDAMTLPIEHLSAEVALAGETITSEGFEAVLGSTDLRGDLRVDGFSRPRVRFDLASRRANLDQLFGALQSGPGATPGGEEDASGGDLLDRVQAEGRLRIEQATWGELEGSDLDGTLRLDHGTVTLEPLTASLYAGRFDGRIDAWPGRSPLPFRVRGSARNVNVAEFLSGALGIEDRLVGRFSGTLDATGSAGEWAEVARSLEGGGEMRIEDGEVESFPLLRSVATLSGVLGEDGLARIANRIAETATRFSVLAGEFRLAGGNMRFDPIVLQSTDYTLRGSGAVDLVRAALDGKGAMTFSAELSELMRAEGSRAAELFWSDAGGGGGGHVNLPLALRGLLSEPGAMVDWEAAAKSYAERRVGREVERQVGKILERLLGGSRTPTPEPPPR